MMKMILAIMMAMIGGLSVNLRAEPLAQQVGEILVPPPKGMVDVADYSDKFRLVAKVQQQKPFGLYYLLNEYEDVDNEKISSSIWATGDIVKIYETDVAAKVEFDKMKEKGKRDFEKIKFSSDDFQKLLKDGVKKSEGEIQNLRVAIQGIAVLDMDFSRPTKSTVVMVSNAAVGEAGEKSDSITLVQCHGWVLIGKTVVHLTSHIRLKDESTSTKAKAAIDEWMDAIAKKNAK